MMKEVSQLERRFESGLFGARWLMAPMYVGLIFGLLMLVVVFFRELWHYVPLMFEISPDEAILAVLSLIDLTLAANLLLIVLYSGYENFVSKLDIEDRHDRGSWMGTVDFAGLKMKLIASMVAISGIHLLKRFMEIGQASADSIYGEHELRWLVIIHVVFVVSGVLMALMDFLAARSKKY